MIDYSLNAKLNDLKNEKDAIKKLMQHSFESFVYSIRTGEFNYAIAKEMGLPEEECEIYFLCGMFHDIGKIGMPKFLIDFPGSYDDEMRSQMKKHTDGGGLILETLNASKHLIETAKYHHCNYDGSGYSLDLKGEDIPFHARLTRVSDSADAYLSTRSYKVGYVVEGLFEDLVKYSNSWYDPKIIDVLGRVHKKTMANMKKSELSPQDNYMKTMKEIYNFAELSENHFYDIAKHK